MDSKTEAQEHEVTLLNKHLLQNVQADQGAHAGLISSALSLSI